jgi:hypothetical protein
MTSFIYASGFTRVQSWKSSDRNHDASNTRYDYSSNFSPTSSSLRCHSFSANSDFRAKGAGSWNWQLFRYSPLMSGKCQFTSRRHLSSQKTRTRCHLPFSAGSLAATSVVDEPSSGVFQYADTSLKASLYSSSWCLPSSDGMPDGYVSCCMWVSDRARFTYSLDARHTTRCRDYEGAPGGTE